jgi:hypothetical protein
MRFKFLIGCVLFCDVCFGAIPQGVNLVDVKTWDIVVAEDASPSEQYAAEEFRDLFKQAGGAELQIVKTAKALERLDKHVYIGSGTAMKASAVGFGVDDYGAEDLRIIIRNNNIAIAGGRPRGTLYGVYVFAEDYLGVRFLTPEHTYVPPLGEWRVVGPVARFYHPPFIFRWSYYYENTMNPPFAVRQRNNAVADDAKFGGKTGMTLINHTLGYQIPIAKYGKEHPEYYCLIDGKRRNEGNDWYDSEPCLTNPDVLRIVTDAVLRELKANPNKENISVSQNDNDKYCRCPNCAAIDEREGTPMGSLLTFVNAVADAVAKDHPKVMVGTLSYWYTQKPPKTIKPRPNVQIQLCSNDSCPFHPMSDLKCPKSQIFFNHINAWNRICENIFIWNYDVNFSDFLLPCANLNVIEPNMRFFASHHAKGVFMQAAYTTYAAEFSDLRNYIMSQLLWDPSKNGQVLMDEFLNLHYGIAAGPIRRFIQFNHDHTQKCGSHPGLGGTAAHYCVDASVAEAAMSAFDEALKLADSDAIRTRVEKASICAYRAALQPLWDLPETTTQPATIEKMRPIAKKLFELCKKFNVTTITEAGPIEGPLKRIKKVLGVAENDPL